MLLGSFNPEKNIAYLDYKELNPTNKEKHDEIFKQMKVHYANYLDALEGSKNKNLDQSIRNQLNIQALSEEGKYKQQMNLITDLMAETHAETTKGKKISKAISKSPEYVDRALLEWLISETIGAKVNRGDKVTAEDIDSAKVPSAPGGGSLGAAAADDPLVFDANEEGVKGINEVDQKAGGDGKFGRYAIYLIDPISELIEDGAIALAAKMGMPKLARAITYWMYYEAANLVGTVVDAIPQAANQAALAQLDQSMILGAGIGLVDEEAFNNWKEDLNSATTKNINEVQEDMYQMGERSPLSHAWGAVQEKTGWTPPSGLDLLSGVKNMMTGTK